ncbi:alanine--tRNA ligase [Candidatus Sumerlaeota bacterium]|nr:alanine--tRNA ligase [Candidatus Sumerlaeota bacterium]
MTIANGRDLRQAYLDYFRGLEHRIVPSAPLVPPDDPTLLFTSAGMVQFKALYSGTVDPMPYVRAASCQKCLRAGGKGSDLENVGKTLRHHTFFEMLGNFSFGDYFKREAIRWAWEFCTSPKYMNLPKERMFPTIYGPTGEEIDSEALQYYAEETDCPNPCIPLDAAENFWGPAGDTGACGPCSEIKFFLGSDAELARIREDIRTHGTSAIKKLGQRVVDEGDLFLEIWNMVFPQFDQQRDGSRPLLKNKGIDTGAGLERMTVALNFARTGKAISPYETDLMWPITQAVAQKLSVNYPRSDQQGGDARVRLAVNAIADHVRTLVFCLAEGLTPGNIGRRYVVRRIQRRALRFASLLGMDKPFMADLYDAVVEAMGDQYPEIKQNPDFIRKALRIEEETFLRTRDRGEKIISELITQAKERGDHHIAGQEAFRLWDTYGYPVDLTIEVAQDAGVSVDLDGYNTALKNQKDEAKKSWKGAKLDFNEELVDLVFETHGATEFVGYGDVSKPTETQIAALLSNGAVRDNVQAGEDALVVLLSTPFYAESGGQISDTGVIENGEGRFVVKDVIKSPQGLYIHKGTVVSGVLKSGGEARASVDAARRTAIRRNHSSVHLLQNALKRAIGQHVTQAGSYVGPDYSRFDFTHTEALTRDDLATIQREVNRMILENEKVNTDVLTLEEAKQKGAIAPFGEKYGAVVRVVQMGPSVEFCGGTHVARTGDIARYRIVSESSIASGVRRIEAVTGAAALEAEINDQYGLVDPLQKLLAAKGPETLNRVQSLQSRIRELDKEVARMRQEAALQNLDAYTAKGTDIPGAKLCIARADGLDGNELRVLATALRDKIGATSVVVGASAADDKISLVVAVGKDAQSKYPAGTVINKLAQPLGGKGGGKPDYAQAGAKDVAKLDDVIAKAADLISS